MTYFINLQLSCNDTNNLRKIKKIEIDSGKDKRQKDLDALILNGRSILNAKELLDIAAPEDNYDFFISHSHADMENASQIASFLRSQGYKVFIDSEYWLYFDEIAEKLNKNHLHNDEKGSQVFDHSKTIDIQKHCDVMLTSSLASVMSKSKVILFLNTPASVIGIEEISYYCEKHQTYSPWIYYEILILNIFYKTQKENSALEHLKLFESNSFKYEIDLNNMIKMTWNNFKNFDWIQILKL